MEDTKPQALDFSKISPDLLTALNLQHSTKKPLAAAGLITPGVISSMILGLSGVAGIWIISNSLPSNQFGKALESNSNLMRANMELTALVSKQSSRPNVIDFGLLKLNANPTQEVKAVSNVEPATEEKTSATLAVSAKQQRACPDTPGSGLNIRDAAGKAINTIPCGEVVYPLEVPVNGKVQVEWAGITGYVSTKFLGE